MAAHRPPARRAFQPASGTVVGVVAGTAFILAEMFFNSMLGKPFFGPPRLIASIVMGKGVLMPGHGGIGVLIVGFIIHYLLSILFGIVSLGIIALILPAAARAWTLLLLGFLAGLSLWGINFYVIAPYLFPQFDMVNAFWNGFMAHAIFGVILGLYLTLRLPVNTHAAANL